MAEPSSNADGHESVPERHRARVALTTLVQYFDLEVPRDRVSDLEVPRDRVSDLLVAPTLRAGDGVDATVSRAECKQAGAELSCRQRRHVARRMSVKRSFDRVV